MLISTHVRLAELSETMTIRGQRTNFNHYTLDGVENTDPNSGLQRGEKCA